MKKFLVLLLTLGAFVSCTPDYVQEQDPVVTTDTVVTNKINIPNWLQGKWIEENANQGIVFYKHDLCHFSNVEEEPYMCLVEYLNLENDVNTIISESRSDESYILITDESQSTYYIQKISESKIHVKQGNFSYYMIRYEN